MSEKILVLGGTGVLGKPVVRRLLADGFNIRVMARDAAKAREVLGAGPEIVEGDATHPTDLERAILGCDGVHLSLSGAAEVIGTRLAAAVAASCGVERISYISGCTALPENDWFPMTAGKLQAEAALKASGVPYTIFAPTWVMEMLPLYVRDGKPLMMGKQEGPFHFFAAEDLARMVSAAYQTDAAKNRRFVVHGPEGMSFAEALERYCAAFYPDAPAVKSMPVWLAKTMAALMRNDMMKFGADLSGYFDRVGEMGDPAEANALLGAPSTTLGEWLAVQKRSRAAQVA